MRFVILIALVCSTVPASARAEPLRQAIDAELQAAWSARKITPASRADDATFLRRVHLDLTGTVPTADETLAFLEDANKDRRGKLVERLLADPRFAAQMAHVWDLMLFGRNPRDESVRRREGFVKWLTGKFANNERYDRLVKDLLLAEDESALFLVQFRNRPEDAAEAISRLFLGTQLQCARCHDHPYEDWKQRDFFGLAGFLVRLVVQESGSGNNRKYTLGEKSSGEVLFSGSAKEQRPGRKGDPVKPKFLGGVELDEPPLPKGFKEPDYRATKALPKPAFSRKVKLAEWVTAKDNPFFARAAVNRVWGQFMGRGLVHPVDDLSDKREAVVPALLKKLTEEFIARDFDLKHLVREIVSSDAYQLSDRGSLREAMPALYERARVRPLSAEELLASMRTATKFDASGGKMNAGATEEYFRRYFGTPTNGQGEFQGGLQEHLFLDNSPNVRELIRRRKGNLADEIATSKEAWEQRVERLFLSVLTRRPTPKERERFAAYLQSAKKTDALIEEAIWVLMNTAEFRFNR